MLRAEQPIGPFYAIIRGDEPQRYHLGAYCRSARSNDMEDIWGRIAGRQGRMTWKNSGGVLQVGKVE
jgi:hypothetical protein